MLYDFLLSLEVLSDNQGPRGKAGNEKALRCSISAALPRGLIQPSEYRLTIYRFANIVCFFKISLKYRYRIFLDNITRYSIIKYRSSIAFHEPVKAKFLYKFLMV